MKSNGYYECFEKVEKARMANPVDTNELEAIRDFYGYDLYAECLHDVIKKHYTEENTMKPNEFYYSNIHGYTIGAEIKEGDFIESVRFWDGYTFTDGWTVINHSGVLGIIWGHKEEFIPFEDFASSVIFTIKKHTAPDLPDFNSPEAFFCEPD